MFTTAPLPDLCISFDTERVVPQGTWQLLLPRTQKLICQEGIDPYAAKRAFAFFFIEAKRSKIHPWDEEVRDQVLNEASQALHNMYEYFREAELEDLFFSKVRVFSSAASEKGIIIRIHRATRTANGISFNIERGMNNPIVEGYPLQFEHKVYLHADDRGLDRFDRRTVVEAVGKIMMNYGEKKLLKLLNKATKQVQKKLERALRNGTRETEFNQYRYGQTGS